MKNENQHLQKKLDSKDEKFVNLATILAEEYSKIPENSRLTLDLEAAENKTNFNEFSNEERQAVFAILMNQIKPFIKRKYLVVPEISNLSVVVVDGKPNTTLLPSNLFNIKIKY